SIIVNIIYCRPKIKLCKGGQNMYNNQHSCPSGSEQYIIKSGDTFYKIAREHNISLDSLLKANPGVDPDRLFIGQIICVPSSTSPRPPSHSCPTLRMGSRGQYVIELQELLVDAGFNPGLFDGIFGSNTRSAVVSFQRSEGLVPDGIVGVKTWTAVGVNCSTSPSPGTCPSGTRPYTVKSVDTFNALAIRYNTTVESIMRTNPNVNPNNLQICQIICIPR